MDQSFVPKCVYCGEIREGDWFFQQKNNLVESCTFVMITGHNFYLIHCKRCNQNTGASYNASKNYT